MKDEMSPLYPFPTPITFGHTIRFLRFQRELRQRIKDATHVPAALMRDRKP